MLSLHTTHQRAIDLLTRHLDYRHNIQKESDGSINPYSLLEWTHTSLRLLGLIYGVDDEHVMNYESIISGNSFSDPRWVNLTLNASMAILRSYISEIRLIIENPEFQEPLENLVETSTQDDLFYLFSKFHLIAKILERNRKNCSNFVIKNEYDVQLLVQALLPLYFEHVRVEEPMGSHAGGSSRMDFVLDDEDTIIEIKYAYDNHTDNEIGKELLIDIARYKSEEKYSELYCLIYDPDHKIINAAILKKDLESHTTDNFEIFVIIEPQR